VSIPQSGPLLPPQAASQPAITEQAQVAEFPESPDDTFPSITDLAFDSGFEDGMYNAVEKIYLCSKSDYVGHRIFIAHALPEYLEQVTPKDAIEYVLPLIQSLALDDGELVLSLWPALSHFAN